MPYIEHASKPGVISYGSDNVGELTWELFTMARAYGMGDETRESFKRHAEVIAALDCAKEEYRRRFLNPYEDRKREANGDA